MNKLKASGLSLIIGTLVVLGFNACDKDDDQGSATVNLLLTDAPGDYQQVNVEVTEVQMHTTSGGWQNFDVKDSIYDLLLLQDSATAVLGIATLPATKFTQLRLILGSQNTVMVDSVMHPLALSSQDETGLKININQLLNPGAVYTLVLDFDADASVILQGNGTYRLKPVLTGTFL